MPITLYVEMGTYVLLRGCLRSGGACRKRGDRAFTRMRVGRNRRLLEKNDGVGKQRKRGGCQL